ncbi:MAG: DUF2231 domain-containing protein [Pelovirga sp.]
MKKKWRCTVCGYVHEGDLPPESCPVCHAGAEKFVPVEDTAAGLPIVSELKAELRQIYEVFAPHAVAAHFPTALVPTAILFLLIGLLFDYRPLEFAAFAVLVVAVVVVPITMVTGLIIRHKDYQASSSAVFRKKIALAWVLLAVGAVTLLWRFWYPEVMVANGSSTVFYFVLHLVMFICVTLLGHYGATLVYGARK